MLINNAISAGVGLVPVAGDFVLAIYKANSRNAALLEEYLRIRGEAFIKREEKKTPPKKIEKDDAGTNLYNDHHITYSVKYWNYLIQISKK